MRAWLKIAAIGVTLLFNIKVWAETITMPSTLTANTSSFVLLSDSGTTPTISGFTATDLLATITASAGTLVVTTTTGLEQASGYCDYTSDSSSEPTNCKLEASDHEEIGFIGTQAEINAAIATLSFKGDGTTGSPTVTLSITPAGSLYNSANGHYYKVVNHGSNITWSAAKTAAEASTLNGLSGYLASITSYQENTFIDEKAGVNAWLGGTDADTEGCWKWSGGPDDGKIFTVGNDADNTTSGGCTVDTGYTVYEKPFGAGEFGWNSNEPNDAGGEDRLHIKTDGTWNDYSNTQNVQYYVIEYGGIEGETATTTGLTTLTISSIEASGSTHQAFDDKQLAGMVEAQTESVKRWMFNSTNSVMGRMEQYRRTGLNNGLKFSDFKLALANNGGNQSIEDKLKKHYIDKYSKAGLDSQGLTRDNVENFISGLPLTKYLKNEFSMETKNWAVWSNGLISSGGVDFSVGELGRRSESEGFTIGADFNLAENSLFGFALRDGTEDVKISTDGSNFNSDNLSISFYNTWKPKEGNFIDTFLSFGETTQVTTRIVDVANNTKVAGELKSQQIFGAVKYNFAKNFKDITFSNYSSLNFSYVMFDNYSETGDSNLKLSFDDRDLESTSVNFGTVVSSDFNFTKSTLFPYLKIEFNEDLTENSTLKASYLSSTSNQYTTDIGKSFSSMVGMETGFDWNFNNGWDLTTTINRIDKNGIGHQNYLKFNAIRIF